MQTNSKEVAARRKIAAAALQTSVSVLALMLSAPSAMAIDITTSTTGDVDIMVDGTHRVRSSGSVTSTDHGDNELIRITPDPFTGSFTNDGMVAIEGFSGTHGRAIGLDGALDGSIVNNGTIRVTHTNVGAASSATAAGIRVNGRLDGTLSNTGRIEVGGLGGGTGVYSHGIRAGDVGGSLLNSGVVSITSRGGSTNSATGILTNSVDAGGTVQNSGTVTIEDSGASYAYASGLRTTVVNGTLQNSGVVSVTSNGSSSASAQGLSASVNSAQITNSGTIAVNADASYAYATGVRASFQDATGSMSNTGTIQARANGLSSAVANGMATFFGAGVISNSGTISAHASASTTAAAFGFFSGSGTGNGMSFSNSGTITATAISGATSASAIGVNVGRVGVGQDVANTGKIAAEASGGRASATGLAVTFYGASDASLVNSGTVTARANGNGSSSVDARGISLSGNTSGLIENSGTISVTSIQVGSSSHNTVESVAFGGRLLSGGVFRNSGVILMDAVDGSGEAVGLRFNQSDSGTLIENTGTIGVTARGESQSAVGAIVSNAAGSTTHAGTISAVAADGADRAVGLDWRGNAASARLLVTGDITAIGGDVENIALDAGGAAGSVIEIESSATFVGTVRARGSDVTLRSVGASATYEFVDSTSTITTEVVDGGSNWFVLDESTSAPTYATVSGEEIGGNPNVLADAVGLLDVQQASLGSGTTIAPDVSRSPANVFGINEESARYFQFQLSSISGGDAGTASDLSSTLLGVSGGFVGTTDDGADLAFGGGFFAASGSSGETDFDTIGAFVGRTTVSDWGGLRFSKGYGGGVMMADQTRMSAGSTPATSDFMTAFVTGHVGIESDKPLASTPFTPFGSLRYTHFFSDGYTETGGTANATVDARNFGVADLKVGGKMSDITMGDGGLTTSFALAYRTAFGSDQDVSIFGQPGTTSFAETDRLGAEFSVQYTQPFKAGELDLGANLGSFEGGSTSLTATARYSIRF